MLIKTFQKPQPPTIEKKVALRMGAKVSSSGEKEFSEKDLAYFTQHTGIKKEQVLYLYPQ